MTNTAVRQWLVTCVMAVLLLPGRRRACVSPAPVLWRQRVPHLSPPAVSQRMAGPERSHLGTDATASTHWTRGVK